MASLSGTIKGGVKGSLFMQQESQRIHSALRKIDSVNERQKTQSLLHATEELFKQLNLEQEILQPILLQVFKKTGPTANDKMMQGIAAIKENLRILEGTLSTEPKWKTLIDSLQNSVENHCSFVNHDIVAKIESKFDDTDMKELGSFLSNLRTVAPSGHGQGFVKIEHTQWGGMLGAISVLTVQHLLLRGWMFSRENMNPAGTERT